MSLEVCMLPNWLWGWGWIAIFPCLSNRSLLKFLKSKSNLPFTFCFMFSTSFFKTCPHIYNNISNWMKSWHTFVSKQGPNAGQLVVWRLFVCIEYIGNECIGILTEGLLRRWGVRDMRWWCRRDIDFHMIWITRVMTGHSFSIFPSFNFSLKVRLFNGHFWIFTIDSTLSTIWRNKES